MEKAKVKIDKAGRVTIPKAWRLSQNIRNGCTVIMEDKIIYLIPQGHAHLNTRNIQQGRVSLPVEYIQELYFDYVLKSEKPYSVIMQPGNYDYEGKTLKCVILKPFYEKCYICNIGEGVGDIPSGIDKKPICDYCVRGILRLANEKGIKITG